jgi:hypothetical protein
MVRRYSLWITASALGLLASAALAESGSGQLTGLPPPLRIRPLQLTQPFTITYRSAIPPSPGATRVGRDLRLTLSYDGGRLLFSNEDLASRVTRTYLFTGRETWLAESNSRLASIESGFDFSRLPLCPLPGVGIPNMPLLSSGLLPVAEGRLLKTFAPNLASEPRYIDPGLYRTPGRVRDLGLWVQADRDAYNPRFNPIIMSGFGCVVTVPAPGASKVLWYEAFEAPGPMPFGHVWEFYNHKRFQGVWLAQKIRMRWYVSGRGSGRLLESATYQLESALDRPLAASAYDPVTYLARHANVGDRTGVEARGFLYEPGNGPLDLQRQGAMGVRRAAALGARSNVPTALVGLILMVVAGACWLLWRRRWRYR